MVIRKTVIDLLVVMKFAVSLEAKKTRASRE